MASSRACRASARSMPVPPMRSTAEEWIWSTSALTPRLLARSSCSSSRRLASLAASLSLAHCCGAYAIRHPPRLVRPEPARMPRCSPRPASCPSSNVRLHPIPGSSPRRPPRSFTGPIIETIGYPPWWASTLHVEDYLEDYLPTGPRLGRLG